MQNRRIEYLYGMKQLLRIAVIGGGAAGYFAALSAKKHHPQAEVSIYEKSNKVLAKVKISGGGRCNVTHACFDNTKLAGFYPRGEHFLKKAFAQFSVQDTINWFAERGVALETLPDNCIFPKSNSSQTIIDCFQQEARKLGVTIHIQQGVEQIQAQDHGFTLHFSDKKVNCERVIVTTGGQPKISQLDWIAKLSLKVVPPFPSLFTFNMPQEPIRDLMGIVVDPATARVEGTKLIADGPLLITHWGMSGPAILKLSAWGARILAEKNYEFVTLVNWLHQLKDEAVKNKIKNFAMAHTDKNVNTVNPFLLSKRLWVYLVDRAGIHSDTRWKALSEKQRNKLVEVLIQDRYQVKGKTTFKEEFVTAGGVALTELDVKTMMCKKFPGLFFAGEVMDIDGITGGFNFQAAWTTGWIAGKACGNSVIAETNE